MKQENNICPQCGKNINFVVSADPSSPAGNPDPLYPTARAALYLRVCTRTLIKWRATNCGPAHIKLHTGKGSVRYRKSALDEFIEAGEVQPADCVQGSKAIA